MPNHHLIPACDTDLETFKVIVEKTHGLDGLGGFKVGFRLGLTYGLPTIVDIVRQHSDKPVIYDHQKGGTDIPEFGDLFVETCKSAGISSVILFPFTGIRVLQAWVKSCQKFEMNVIVGGVMTHPGFLYSEGGVIADDAVARIYAEAADCGVTDFVVPATRPELSWQIFDMLKNRGVDPTFYSPGIGTQGGKWSDLCRSDGPSWHAIVGRSLYRQGDVAENAKQILEQR